LRRAATLAVAALALAAAPASAQSTLALSGCKQPGFECGTLQVPLDRSGQVPGTIPIRVAVQSPAPAGATGVLVILFGGPGQGATGVASIVGQSESPVAKGYRVVLIDQRGTGHSGVLKCPQLQSLLTLDGQTAEQSAQCANEIGPNRAFYTTTDTVDDLEALRVALGVPKLAVQGTSYGTYVAAEYARRYPDKTDRLILDSVIGPAGVDTFETDSFGAMPRILRAQCAGGGCSGITSDPVADVSALAKKLSVKPLRGSAPGPNGTRQQRTITAVGLSTMVFAGDLNPHLQAAMPAALHEAVNGDTAQLLRLVRPALGPALKASDLSAGLYTATSCTDVKLSYPLSTPFDQRKAPSDAALAALPRPLAGPFDNAVLGRVSYDEACRLWPSDATAQPSAGPLPDVPTLVLDGGLDVRTPMENGKAMAALVPHAQQVTVPGTGHDEIDSDLSGCVRVVLQRFFTDKAVGDPCSSISNEVPPAPLAPTSLARTPVAPGNHGQAGRVLTAAIGAVNDTREYFVSISDGGLKDTSGGGLRGGTWKLVGTRGVRLSSVSWVPSVKVSGSFTSTVGRYKGTIHVTAPNGLGGTLTLDRKKGVDGTLGGHHVHLAERFARGGVQRSIEKITR
jgi:pimeloyl-ACP methyl ester carboxylesterase